MRLVPRPLVIVLLVGLASARAATADPVPSRVLTAPTAWLPPAGAAIGTAGSDHRGAGSLIVGYGLGGLAAVELGTDTDVRGGGDDPEARWLGRAAFRLGARQDAWFAGMPALVVGVRTTFAARGHTYGKARASEAYLVGSRALGPTRVHLGAAAIDGGFGDTRLGATVRPLAGLEWTPPIYPRTSILADVMWVPRLDPDRVRLEWVAGWGVRYQALSWGSIELAVRHRQDEGLGDSTVLVRLNGVFAPPASR